MAATAGAQCGVALLAARIAHHGDACPMIHRIGQPLVAGQPALHEAALAAAFGDRRLACQGTDGVVVSPAQGLAGLGEQRGADDPSNPWHGVQDRHVTLLDALPRHALPRLAPGSIVCGPANCWQSASISVCTALIWLLSRRMRGSSRRMWPVAASVTPGADGSGGSRRTVRTWSASSRRMRCVLRIRAMVSLCSLAPLAGVGACCHSSSNQGAARLSSSASICG